MRTVELLDDPPSPNSVEVMAAVDRLSQEWRQLVHEFGIAIVSEVMPEAQDVHDARAMLEYWRAQRQARWLATNYVTKKTFRMAA